MRKVIVGVLVVAAVGGAYALLAPRGNGVVAGPVAVETPFPELRGDAVSGGTLDLAEYRGHVTVLNVWANWCPPCRREQPGLARAARRYRSDGVRFVGVNYQDDLELARSWIDEFHVPYDSLFDPSGQFADDLAFPYVPDTYIVDSAGTIRWVIFGETNEAELTGLIDRVLAAEASAGAATPSATA
jgi:thiol-disulfide isomerase/thioredoxin